MLAGALDRRITLQVAATTENDFGEQVGGWVPLATVWASKKDVSDGERVRAAEVGATITTRFQIRWSATVAALTEADQLTFDGRAYAITAIKGLGRREGLEISAVARAE